MAVAAIPDVFSQVFGLGGVVEFYPLKKANRVGNIIGMLFFFGGAGLTAVFALWMMYDNYQANGFAGVLNGIFFPIVIALILVGLGALILWSFLRNRNKAAVVYESGLAYSDHKGLRSWRWDEINSLTSAVTKHYTNGIYTGTTHVYTLIKKDGEKFVLNDQIKDVEKLASQIREKIFPLLYTEFADAYNAGKSLLFGPVKLSKASGIQIGKKQYQWSEISEVGINRGLISVKKKDGGWFSGATASAAAVPNLEVMLSIINQVVGLKTGR